MHDSRMVRFEFTVTQAAVDNFVGEVIGQCYMTEVPQYVDVYLAENPYLYEDVMEFKLCCRCLPEFRFILTFTQNFGILDRPVKEMGGWKVVVFQHPTDPIGALLYAMLRFYVLEGTSVVGDSYDDPEQEACRAHGLTE